MIDTLDLNLLEEAPEETTTKRGSSKIILWLIALSLATLLLPLYLISTAIKEDNVGLQVELNAVQTALASTPVPNPEVVKLEATLASMTTQSKAIEPISTTLLGTRYDWRGTMAIIANYNAAELVLTAVSMAENRLTLNGRTVSEANAIAYVHQLEETQQFKRVVIQSIVLKTKAGSVSDGKPSEFVILVELKELKADDHE